MRMKNAMIYDDRYLVQFVRVERYDKSVYYKAYLYDKPGRVNDPVPPQAVITVSSNDSFNSYSMKLKYKKYGHDIIWLLLYTCKLLFLTETKYLGIKIPIKEVNPKEYSKLDRDERIRLGYNLSRIIKTLYYDEFKWDKVKFNYYDITAKKHVKTKLITFERVGIDYYKYSILY